VIEILCECAGFAGEWIREERRAADVDHHIGNGRLLAEVTGYRPRTTLRDGLERTFAWYRDHVAEARP
jgi:nucleoside-diphosphate-sugar epimerase